MVAEVNATTLVDMNLANGIAYTYGIASVNDAGQSDPSYVVGIPRPTSDGQSSVFGGLFAVGSGLAYLMLISGVLASLFLISMRRRGNGRRVSMKLKGAMKLEPPKDPTPSPETHPMVGKRTVRVIKRSSATLKVNPDQEAFDRTLMDLDSISRK